MSVDWGLATRNAVNPLEALQVMGLAQQRRQQEEERARQRQSETQLLASYDIEKGRFDPRAARAALVTGRDAKGLMSFDKQYREESAASQKAMLEPFGQAIQDVLRRPEAERGAVWDAYVDQFSTKFPDAAQFKGRYSEQVARAILAETGMLDDFNKAAEPNYQVIPAGGKAIGFQFGVPMQGGAPAPQGGPVQPSPTDDGPLEQRETKILRRDQAEQVIRQHGRAFLDSWAKKFGFTIEGEAARPARADRAALEAEAQRAIAAGADPAAVNARLAQMLGGN